MTLDFETKRSTGASVTHISCRSFDSATSFARPRTNSLTPGVLNVRAGVKMAEGGDPLNYKITGRSTLRPLTEPSMTYLRIRSIFGATARAEILRCLLYNVEFDRISVQMLADQTNYGKRIVAESAESLAHAGILRQRLHKQSECVRACGSERPVAIYWRPAQVRAGMERPAGHSRNVARDIGSLG